MATSAATAPNTFLLKTLTPSQPYTPPHPPNLTRHHQTPLHHMRPHNRHRRHPTTSSTAQDHVFNFVAGPSTLPENVIRKAEYEL
ncbi:hypothetical protein Tco_1167507 [Tanacetum coccineum]